MARPKNASAVETRRRLVGVAGELFATRGLGDVSLREIAKAASVTAPAVIHYFGSKEALYEECIEALYARLADLRGEIAESISGAKDFDGALDAGVRAVFGVARRNQSAIKLLLRHVADTGEIGTERREKQLLPFLDQGASLFAALTGRTEAELRIVLQSIVFLVGRWAVASPREVQAVTGLRGPVRAFAAIEDHLVDVARRQLGPAPAPSNARSASDGARAMRGPVGRAS